MITSLSPSTPLRTLSSSRMLAYLHCPRGYWFKNVEQIPMLPNLKMTRGIVFHDALKHNYRQKYSTHEDLALADLQAYYAASFELVETDYGSEDPGKYLDSGVAALGEYQKVVAPYVQPLEVEEAYVMDFRHVEWNFQGKIDLVEVSHRLFETKTTAVGLSAPRQDHLIQVSAYTMAYKRRKIKKLSEKMEGEDLSRATAVIKEAKSRLDYAICGQQKQRVISFDIEVTQEDERMFLNLLAQVAKGIKNEIWPHNRIDNYCSRRFCSYWRECESLCGGRVKD